MLRKQKHGLVSAAALTLISVILLCFSGCQSSGNNADHPVCEIVIKDFGTVTVTLDRTAAPITVDHFTELARKGAYDGSVITRIQAGFVLQGGEGAKDSSTIKGEFASNGVDNPIKHKKGVISMARATSYNSASSQFFIMLDDASSLDGDYAAFGSVTGGWNVIEKIISSKVAKDFRNDYYGVAMGFLNEEAYITIETVKVVSD
ncbi:MAG: peptidylprolyl isomerase [Clostridia bacterium]|nr:peptidylprolyl isomerase [Clostridia bacterium]